MRDGACALGWPSLIVAGTADDAHDAKNLETVATSLNAQTLLIDGADPSLEIRGDVLATTDALRAVATATLDFMQR